MKERGHIMLISARRNNETRDPALAGRWYREDEQRRREAEAARLGAVKAGCAIPEECGSRIIPAPARGGFRLHRNIELLPVGTDKVEAVHRGHGGRAAIWRSDVFDGMIAAALRAKRDVPLTPGQIAVGRRYHDLVELLSADGTKLSKLQDSFGGGTGRDWMDRRMELSAELDGMRRRIGIDPAMVLRRVRPSQRKRELKPGEAAPHIFTRRDLVDAVCLKGKTIKQTLALFGWTDSGRNCKAAIEALAEALDAMIGYRD